MGPREIRYVCRVLEAVAALLSDANHRAVHWRFQQQLDSATGDAERCTCCSGVGHTAPACPSAAASSVISPAAPHIAAAADADADATRARQNPVSASSCTRVASPVSSTTAAAAAPLQATPHGKGTIVLPPGLLAASMASSSAKPRPHHSHHSRSDSGDSSGGGGRPGPRPDEADLYRRDNVRLLPAAPVPTSTAASGPTRSDRDRESRDRREQPGGRERRGSARSGGGGAVGGCEPTTLTCPYPRALDASLARERDRGSESGAIHTLRQLVCEVPWCEVLQGRAARRYCGEQEQAASSAAGGERPAAGAAERSQGGGRRGDERAKEPRCEPGRDRRAAVGAYGACGGAGGAAGGARGCAAARC